MTIGDNNRLTTEEVEAVRAAHYAIAAIEDRIAALREEMRQHKEAVKALGISLADFNYHRKLWRFDDDDRKEAAIQSRMRAWQALGIGTQPSLFDQPATATLQRVVDVDGESAAVTSSPGVLLAADAHARKRGRPPKLAPAASAETTTVGPMDAPPLETPFIDGQRDYARGVAFSACPFEDSTAMQQWQEGWKAAQEAMCA